MDGIDTQRLARTYEPVLLFSRDGQGVDESFFPMDAAQFVAGSRLYAEGTTLVRPAGGLTLEVLAALPESESAGHFLIYALDDAFEFRGEAEGWVRRSGELPPAAPRAPVASADGSPASATDSAQASLAFAQIRQLPHAVRDRVLARYSGCRDLTQHPPPYYYRVTSDRGYLVIQYWMFYAYNDWGLAHSGLNDHEGDWEAVFVYLRNDQPAYVAYSAHVGKPDTHEWSSDAFERRLDTHPVVYVACGSHAAYAASGERDIVIRSAPGVDTPISYTDHAYGNSEESLGPGERAEWGPPVDLDGQSWATNFAGRWGAAVTRLDAREIGRGAQGPVGPAWQTEKWESPVEWAQIPD